MTELIYESAINLAEKIRKKELSSLKLTELYMKRINEINPDINALVQINQNAREEAYKQDEKMKNNNFEGPLHGLPITIKDSLDTAGIITTGGTKGRKNYIPERDATVVKRLKNAGAIILGKSNTPELTLEYETDNKIYGKTSNPYDLGKSSGGSSGGAAAAVVTGCSAFDIGSDTAGSIRLPAHFCGAVGLKPTFGRVPATGNIIPPGTGVVNKLTQIGPITRYVEDASLVMSIIAGPDGSDPDTVPVNIDDYNYYKKLNVKDLNGIYYYYNDIVKVENEIKTSVQTSVNILSDRGINIEKSKLPMIDKSFSLFKRIFSADGWTWKYSLLKKHGTIDKVEEKHNRAISGVDFNKLLGEWQTFKNKLLQYIQNYDFIISPVTAFPAREHGFSYNKDVIPSFSYTMLYNLLGWPVITVRAGMTDSGLPIGVQIAAPPWREDVCLKIASIIERDLGGYCKPKI